VIAVNWRRFGDERPVQACPTAHVLVIRAEAARAGWRRISSGFYGFDDGEWFLGEDFHAPDPDDLWCYQHELLPKP
jgi:hypothetical protein